MGEKKNRYIEAYRRIDTSIESSHYFETITIEESVISDRLASFLEATGALQSEDIHRQNFSSLILLWRLATRVPGSIWGSCDDLIENVNKWRTQRNKYVHGLVKFPNQKANVPTTEEFLKGAMETAKLGKELSQLVSDWRNRQAQIKRKHNKSLKPTSSSSLRSSDVAA